MDVFIGKSPHSNNWLCENCNEELKQEKMKIFYIGVLKDINEKLQF